jgi:hypothetical protein
MKGVCYQSNRMGVETNINFGNEEAKGYSDNRPETRLA